MKCEKHPGVMLGSDGFGNFVCGPCLQAEVATLKAERDALQNDIRLITAPMEANPVGILLKRAESAERTLAELRGRLEAARAEAEDFQQECLDTEGLDCTVSHRCPREDICWVTRVFRALAADTEGASTDTGEG